MVWGMNCLIDQSTNAKCVCVHQHVEGRRGVPSVVTNQTFALSLTHTSPSYAFKSKTSPFWKNMQLTSSPPHFFRINHSLLQHCGYFQCHNAGLKGSLSELKSSYSCQTAECHCTSGLDKTFLSLSSSPNMSCGNITWMAACSQGLALGKKKKLGSRNPLSGTEGHSPCSKEG